MFAFIFITYLFCKRVYYQYILTRTQLNYIHLRYLNTVLYILINLHILSFLWDWTIKNCLNLKTDFCSNTQIFDRDFVHTVSVSRTIHYTWRKATVTFMTVSFIRHLIWHWPSIIQIWGWPNVMRCMTVSFIQLLIWNWRSMIQIWGWPNVTTCMTVSSIRPLWWLWPSMVQISGSNIDFLKYFYVSAHLTNVVYYVLQFLRFF